MAAQDMPEEKSDKSKSSDPRLGGMAVVGWLAVSGAICLVSPNYLAITGAWRSVFFWLAVVLGAFGVMGALMELERLRNQEGWAYLGAAAVFLVPALALFLFDRSHELESPWKGLSRGSVLVLCAIGSGLLLYGIAYFAEPDSEVRERRKATAKKGQILRSIEIAIISLLNLATAVIGLIAATRGGN
jgi:hypothetical protein